MGILSLDSTWFFEPYIGTKEEASSPEEIEDHIAEVSNIRSVILGRRTLSNLCLDELIVAKGVGYSEKVISNNDRIEWSKWSQPFKKIDIRSQDRSHRLESIASEALGASHPRNTPSTTSEHHVKL